MSSSPPIIVAAEDRERLLQLIDLAGATTVTELLEAEIERARVVTESEVPPDVVTMNSELEYEDATTLERRALRLVYPPDANSDEGRISILAPLGCALLGLRVGQEIEWQMPGGVRRLRVTSVTRAKTINQ